MIKNPNFKAPKYKDPKIYSTLARKYFDDHDKFMRVAQLDPKINWENDSDKLPWATSDDPEYQHYHGYGTMEKGWEIRQPEVDELKRKISSLEAQLKKDQGLLDDLLLSQEHAEWCAQKLNATTVCSCMDRFYYNIPNLLGVIKDSVPKRKETGYPLEEKEEEIQWVELTKEEFDAKIKEQKYIVKHDVMICEPSITFYWNKKNEGEDWSFGQHAFAKRVNDYVIDRKLNTCTNAPKYYLRG